MLFMNLPVYFWFELLSLIICLFFFRRLRHSILFYFVPYLFLIVLFEFGMLKGWFTNHTSNLWLINIITTIEFIFFSLILIAITKKRQIKRVASAALGTVVFLTIFNVLFIQGVHKLHTYTFLLGSALLIFNACYILYELLDFNTNGGSILYEWSFWIVTGVLFFYLGEFVFFCFFEYMIRSKDIRYSSLFNNISTFSNAILYTCIIIAVVCRNKVQKLSSLL